MQLLLVVSMSAPLRFSTDDKVLTDGKPKWETEDFDIVDSEGSVGSDGKFSSDGKINSKNPSNGGQQNTCTIQ